MMSSGKRKRDEYAPHLSSGGHLPQRDGSGEMMVEFFLPETNHVQNSLTGCGRETAITKTLSNKGARASEVLPQQDGIHDDHDESSHSQGVASEDYSTPAEHVELRATTPSATPSVGTPRPSRSEAGEDDEPPLNEDDDDDEDLDDLEQEEEEPNTQHLILAQFDKVTRTKSRWKCILKDGIMHLHSRDILFNKATGEFDF